MDAKRIFDFFLALFGIIVSFPLWGLISFFVWIQDGAPIFYRQERVGKDARIFQCLKFRSMCKHAETITGPLQARENDARITRFGVFLRRTAMDELPQLYNILKGDMSFVGPRALRSLEQDVGDQEPVVVWSIEGFRERSRVRPGLTGVAQIFAPRDISRAEKFKYDIWYIAYQSFWLDMQLIILSFLITFKADWENRGNKVPAAFRSLVEIV